jgi:hypothetical protein
MRAGRTERVGGGKRREIEGIRIPDKAFQALRDTHFTRNGEYGEYRDGQGQWRTKEGSVIPELERRVPTRDMADVVQIRP